MTPYDDQLWAFEYFYHRDKMNACVHCAPVQFSPVTVRLFDALFMGWSEHEDITVEMAEVLSHRNYGRKKLEA